LAGRKEREKGSFLSSVRERKKIKKALRIRASPSERREGEPGGPPATGREKKIRRPSMFQKEVKREVHDPAPNREKRKDVAELLPGRKRGKRKKKKSLISERRKGASGSSFCRPKKGGRRASPQGGAGEFPVSFSKREKKKKIKNFCPPTFSGEGGASRPFLPEKKLGIAGKGQSFPKKGGPAGVEKRKKTRLRPP